jgi:hypothetical protein
MIKRRGVATFAKRAIFLFLGRIAANGNSVSSSLENLAISRSFLFGLDGGGRQQGRASLPHLGRRPTNDDERETETQLDVQLPSPSPSRMILLSRALDLDNAAHSPQLIYGLTVAIEVGWAISGRLYDALGIQRR